MSYICTSHGTYESWHIWVMAHMNDSWHTWMSHVTHEWVISMNMQASMNESCHAYKWVTYVTVMAQTSHGTYEWIMAHMNESCHTRMSQFYEYADINEWLILQVWMSHVTYEWVMAQMNQSFLWICRHQCMSHVTHMNESWHVWMSHSYEYADIMYILQSP